MFGSYTDAIRIVSRVQDKQTDPAAIHALNIAIFCIGLANEKEREAFEDNHRPSENGLFFNGQSFDDDDLAY